VIVNIVTATSTALSVLDITLSDAQSETKDQVRNTQSEERIDLSRLASRKKHFVLAAVIS